MFTAPMLIPAMLGALALSVFLAGGILAGTKARRPARGAALLGVLLALSAVVAAVVTEARYRDCSAANERTIDAWERRNPLVMMGTPASAAAYANTRSCAPWPS